MAALKPEWQMILGINELNLSYEFTHLAGNLGEFNSLLAEAQDAEMRRKLELGQVEARVDGECRAVLTAVGDKKPTEAMVERAMALHADVQAARLRHIDAITDRNRIKAVCEGLDAKKSMLMSLGAFQRAEFGDTVMRERAVEKGKF